MKRVGVREEKKEREGGKEEGREEGREGERERERKGEGGRGRKGEREDKSGKGKKGQGRECTTSVYMYRHSVLPGECELAKVLHMEHILTCHKIVNPFLRHPHGNESIVNVYHSIERKINDALVVHIDSVLVPTLAIALVCRQPKPVSLIQHYLS